MGYNKLLVILLICYQKCKYNNKITLFNVLYLAHIFTIFVTDYAEKCQILYINIS